MDLVCSIDDNYVQHCCVMLTSFFENNREISHHIYLLTEGLTKENVIKIQSLVNSYGGFFSYYLVDNNMTASCPVKDGDHLTIATYYRLFMADILPSHVDKVLYLDCDVVINDSIDELWNTSLDGYALAAIEELGCSLPDVYERLEYNKDFGYFNAGVLLVNLIYWREFSLTKRFLEYVTCNSAKLKSHDQDVLNALLYNKCLHVSCKWNVEEAFYHYSVIKRLKYNSELLSILQQPKILHYTWKPKPWEPLCKHPFRLNYFLYLRKLGTVGLSFKQKILAYLDKYTFCFLIRMKIKGHQYYKL